MAEDEGDGARGGGRTNPRKIGGMAGETAPDRDGEGGVRRASRTEKREGRCKGAGTRPTFKNLRQTLSDSFFKSEPDLDDEEDEPVQPPVEVNMQYMNQSTDYVFEDQGK